MYKNNYGFTGGALLMLPIVRKIREHIEFQKFQCRVLVDNEKTREFKKRTNQLRDKIYKFRYNNPAVEKLTAAGKKENATK